MRTQQCRSSTNESPTREVWQAAGEMGGPYGSAVDIFDDIDKICPKPSEITETTSGKPDAVEQYKTLVREKAELEKNFRSLAKEKADMEEKYRNLARKKGNCGNK